MLVTMKELLDRASKDNYAVAAPNVGSENDARAVIRAAEALRAPLILDVAYGATPDIFLLGHIYRYLAEHSDVPIAINLDHGANKTQVIKAIQAGFTSVMFDRSSCPLEQNVAEVREVAAIAHLAGVSVEAELGHVGVAEHYDVDRDAALTSPAEALDFITRTGVDCLAVAIGTAHGAYPRGFKPYLDFGRLKEIKDATHGFPLVLHGSSGTDNESLRKACAMGINKVNIANDLCQASVKAAKEGDFAGNKAYMFTDVCNAAVTAKLTEMIKVYGSAGKAWIPSYVSLKGTETANRNAL